MRRCNARSLGRLATQKPLLYKAPSKVGVWLSLVEHRVRDAGVAGSNPATPTISFPPAPQAPKPFGSRRRVFGAGRLPDAHRVCETRVPNLGLSWSPAGRAFPR